MMFSKTNYVRSPKLMALYRTIACQHCGRDDGTVCGAHSNQAIHGKGRGIKASDDRVASLCHVCHTLVDQSHRMSQQERLVFWTRAHVKTVVTLVAMGKWPRGIEIPDLQGFVL